jgi:hypothetical protein
VIAGLKRRGVKLVLGERVMTWPQDPECLDGTPKRITTNKGNTFEADIVVSFPVLQAWPSHPPLHRLWTSKEFRPIDLCLP